MSNGGPTKKDGDRTGVAEADESKERVAPVRGGRIPTPEELLREKAREEHERRERAREIEKRRHDKEAGS